MVMKFAGNQSDMPGMKLQDVSQKECAELPDDLFDIPYQAELPDDSGENSFVVDIRNCPIENGRWEGERGNSKWKPDPDFVPQKSNPEKKPWRQIFGETNTDGILFKDGEPQFDDYSKGTVQIEGFSTYRDDNFDKADIKLAEQKGCSPENVRIWRKNNGYTWHECKDMSTMQKVPGIMHNNIPHRGGISNAKLQ